MRFLFWTFLDIFKMSIFGFLKIIFFGRTEKSGKRKIFNQCIENGKKTQYWNVGNFKNFLNRPLKIGHF
jgi:hypothetical protein